MSLLTIYLSNANERAHTQAVRSEKEEEEEDEDDEGKKKRADLQW